MGISLSFVIPMICLKKTQNRSFYVTKALVLRLFECGKLIFNYIGYLNLQIKW